MGNNLLGTDQVTQIGIVVKDILKTRAEWAKVLGCEEPPITQTDGFDKGKTHFNGKPSQATARLCFFNVGQLQIELIEPDGQASTWQNHLEEYGETVQHIAFKVPSMKEARANLNLAGHQTNQYGEYEGGRYAYVDSQKKLGVHIELLEND